MTATTRSTGDVASSPPGTVGSCGLWQLRAGHRIARITLSASGGTTGATSAPRDSASALDYGNHPAAVVSPCPRCLELVEELRREAVRVAMELPHLVTEFRTPREALTHASAQMKLAADALERHAQSHGSRP